MSDVSDGLKRFISGYAAKSADKKFHVPYQRKNLALDLVKVHDDRFSSLGGDKYFACVDMKGTDGKIYDVDFFMVVQTGKLTVTETSVHKINGKPLYNWKEEKGVWKKVKVVVCSRGRRFWSRGYDGRPGSVTRCGCRPPLLHRATPLQMIASNAEDIFHRYGGRLHELVPFRLDLCRKGLVQ